MTIPGIKSQRDAAYSAILLGYNTDSYYNIYHFGCAITGAANILWWVTGDSSWTPKRVNTWLIQNKGYAPGGGLIIWGKLAELLRQYGIEYKGYTTSLAGTNGFLAPENNYAIAQLTKSGFPMHFSAMPYVGQIADSWDAKLKRITSDPRTTAYTFVGAHLYSKIVQAPAPVLVPPTSPAPIQTPAVPPVVPVPSVEKPIENPNPETEIPVEATPAEQPAPAAEAPAAPTPGTIVQPDNAPEAPDTDEAEPAEPEVKRTYPIRELAKPTWVEVAPIGGAEIRDVRDDTPLKIAAAGSKFLATHFAVNGERSYLISEKMAKEEVTQGVDPGQLRRTTAPSMDTIATKPEVDDTPLEIKLDDFSKAGRTILKALHALFGDWHVFKFFDRNKKE